MIIFFYRSQHDHILVQTNHFFKLHVRVLTLRCGGWPPFPVPRPQGGFPRREAAWEKCDAGEVAVHLWRRVRSSLGKCLPVRSKHGLEPAALQRRERANRERQRNGRELDDEREWKSWLPNWITPSFFPWTSHCQDHGDFLFSLILREKEKRGGGDTASLPTGLRFGVGG